VTASSSGSCGPDRKRSWRSERVSRLDRDRRPRSRGRLYAVLVVGQRSVCGYLVMLMDVVLVGVPAPREFQAVTVQV